MNYEKEMTEECAMKIKEGFRPVVWLHRDDIKSRDGSKTLTDKQVSELFEQIDFQDYESLMEDFWGIIDSEISAENEKEVNHD